MTMPIPPPVIYHPTILAGDRPGQLAADRIIGEPQRLAERVKRTIRDNTESWLGNLLERIRDNERAIKRRDTAHAVVQRWAREAIERDESFPRRVTRGSLFADMGGRLLVAGVELGENKLIKLASDPEPVPALEAFFDQDFDQAISFFRAKQLMTEAEFDGLQDRYRQHGFVARKLASDELQEHARRILNTEIEAGRSIDEISAKLNKGLGLGNVNAPTEAASDAYLENVARTNVATSYGAGRWQQLNDPDVQALRPFLQFRTAGDSRVREAHAALNGIVVRSGSDLAAQYAPPLGFRCRCVYTSLSARQLRARGLTVRTSFVPDPRTGQPIMGDRGFRDPPAPMREAA